MQLFIANKNYSSWSMRPWVLMRQAGIPFEERLVRFDDFSGGGDFRERVAGVTPVGKVPVLVDDGLAVWDSLAIAEYLADRFPERHLWPQDARARARARSVCAEMHAGFTAIRTHCPMNIEASLPEAGRIIWRDQPGVRADMERIVAMWAGLLAEHGGPMLFGEFGIADAYYAPVCTRIRTYALPVPPVVAAYIERVFALPGVAAWIADALAEKDFIPQDEPWRAQR